VSSQQIRVLGGNAKVQPGSELYLFPPDWTRHDFRPPAPAPRAAAIKQAA
jgi:hypothetical protein